jgi:[protein-PII] uridylyltransferase
VSTAPQPSGETSPLRPPETLGDPAARALYRQEFERARRDFDASGEGLRCAADRSAIVNRLVLTLWDSHLAPSAASGVVLSAIGGYGREQLFPFSDVDLLFLTRDDEAREAIKEPVRNICQQMWDAGLRVSPATRTLAECARFDQDNIEFTLSLLNGRYLAGDSHLFAQLQSRKLPEMVARESDSLLQGLANITATRHQRFGNTVFHLEPNIKDGPGGLRDCHVSQWIEKILGGENISRSQSLSGALEFLSSARCHLHYASNRDDNTLSWAAQEHLALRGVGTDGGPVPAAEWMRLYFGHARTVFREASNRLSQASQRRSSLYRSFQHWRSRISNTEFSVIDGRAYFQQSGDARDAEAVLRMFAFVAKHGVSLSTDAERRISEAHRRLVDTMPQDARLWPHLRDILAQPHGAEALRAMHSLNLLSHALPEFETVNLLVLRDLYHRYTVDEHTFLAIDILHNLPMSRDEALRPFAELLSEIEHPELLYLTLLLHDTGKGLEGSDHVYSSLQFAQTATKRLGLSKEDAWMVCFLVSGHLEMSSTMRRRDIYDPAAVAELAEKIGTPERLKMLTLLTLADIKAVNPDALTPWKAENLWRLYISTANYFDRSADSTLAADISRKAVDEIVALQPLRRREVLAFLDGLPQRYILSHTSEDVIQHFRMATRLAQEPVQLLLRPRSGDYELSVVTRDRDGLFRMLTGVLYGWGMDIAKAAAFSNSSGVVLDNFHFKDRFRTLELNPTERERFVRSVREILHGEASLDKLLESRLRADQRPVKLTVETRIRHDNECSDRNSLLEVVTQDRPGLLHTISSTLTQEECSIEVALIDTEGPLAHDVFYLTRKGEKLTSEQMRDLEWALASELADSIPTW